MRPNRLVPVVLAAAVVLAACTNAPPAPSATSKGSAPSASSATSAGTPSATSAATPSSHSSTSTAATSSPLHSTSSDERAAAALRRLTLAQRVGQLFMVGVVATGVGASTLSAVSRRHVGNVMLTGRSTAGVTRTRQVVDRVRRQVSSAATGGVPLFVATDQEGGAVQVLRGSGFSAIPTALEQGTWSADTLRSRASSWGGELKQAGVNLNLAPVADTVPSAAAASSNPPIGRFRREFGYATSRVGDHAAAFARGMASAGVGTAVKHFPGLGRVTGNTDTTSGVTDTTTTSRDPYLEPFRQTVGGGAAFVMMSTALYSRIDAGTPAAFSATVVGGVLRGRLGFTGVVISDDLGQSRQVARWSPGQRAVLFVRAGGDMVLTVDPSVLPSMYDAVLARAERDGAFHRQVDAAALRVLRAKASQGILPK